MTNKTIARVIKIQAQGKKIFCMNRVRMGVLRMLWNKQKQLMIEQLKKSKSPRKKDNKKRTNALVSFMSLEEEVREHALKSYFHFCKEQ